MGPINTFRFLAVHPLTADRKLSALRRWLRWQLGSRLLGWPVVVPFVENARLIARSGMTGATGNIYCGLHEFADMAFVLHFLRPEDLFVDIGANVGTYSVLASAVVGARTVAIEPVPESFGALEDNIRLNGIERLVNLCNVAVGRDKGEISFTLGLDTGNHVVATGEKLRQEAVTRVPVVPLPDLLGGTIPSLVKMDVEGFEAEVVAGAESIFSDPSLDCVIMELNGSGSRYGFEDEELASRMDAFGLHAKEYRPLTRELRSASKISNTGNTLFVRNEDRVSSRLETAKSYRVLDRSI